MVAFRLNFNSSLVALSPARLLFSMVPESGQILFTIRTYIEPVLKWAHIPGALADLVTMLAGMSPKTRAYKGVTQYEDALRHYLANLQS
mgnify:CR=1 FL=1